jgi:hypothetical protein
VNNQIRRVFQLTAFDGQRSKLIREAVPSVKGAEIQIAYLEHAHVLESYERYSAVEGELLEPADETRTAVGREPQEFL